MAVVDSVCVGTQDFPGRWPDPGILGVAMGRRPPIARRGPNEAVGVRYWAPLAAWHAAGERARLDPGAGGTR